MITLQALWDFVSSTLQALVVSILLIILGYIYRNKIISRLRGVWYWVFNCDVAVKGFITYIGLGNMNNIDEKTAEFVKALNKSGFQVEKIENGERKGSKFLITKAHLSFRFGVLEVPDVGEDGESYKIRIDVVNGIFTYRTGIENLSSTMNEVVNIVGQAFGSKAQNINYILEMSNIIKGLDSKYKSMQTLGDGKISVTNESIRTEQRTLDSSIRMIRNIAVKTLP